MEDLSFRTTTATQYGATEEEGVGGGEEEEFQSCCSENNDDDEKDEILNVKMYFKGVSIDGICDGDSNESPSGFTGIGVLIENNDFYVNFIQKRLDFYVDDLIANYLALIDGLLEVLNTNNNKFRCSVSAACDSKILYQQIMLEKNLDMPLMVAFRERVLNLVGQFDTFSLELVPSVEVERPLRLAQVAIGLVSSHEENHGSLQNCSICCNDKPPSMMLTLRCFHKFCTQCLKTYANEKLEAGRVPIRCPQLGCNYSMSTSECKLFLPLMFYDVLEKAMKDFNVFSSEKVCCPYQNCLALLNPRECLPADTISSDEADECRIDCPVCQRSICMNCGAPWHNLLSCGEYQDRPLHETDFPDRTLHCLAQDARSRRCPQCQRSIELVQGCYRANCWCGHEFCYLCDAVYRDGQQTCQCSRWDESSSEVSVGSTFPEADQWAWDSFETFPMILDAYSDQERSQLAIIQRFLAGGFSLSDHHSCQLSPPPCTDSYIDAMKDLHQLPWLERFVSVISDSYYDDYIH